MPMLAERQPPTSNVATVLGQAETMPLILAVFFGIAWIGGFAVMHMSSVALHVLLILALASFVVHVDVVCLEHGRAADV